jgi:DNA invertase Pin-like site-specific DNA recombinase
LLGFLLLRDCGPFDVVAVWRFDRCARSTSHLLRALEEFQSLSVDFVSLCEAIHTSTPTGKMVFTILASVAELERSTIRERVMAGQRAAKRRAESFLGGLLSKSTLIAL